MCSWLTLHVSWLEMGGLRKIREVGETLGSVRKKRHYIRHGPVKGIPDRAEGTACQVWFLNLGNHSIWSVHSAQIPGSNPGLQAGIVRRIGLGNSILNSTNDLYAVSLALICGSQFGNQ